jgi:hypothetical protein
MRWPGALAHDIHEIGALVSMPLPIHVALIGSTVSQVSAAQKHFRLSAPGIGATYLAALNASPGGKIVPPTDLPKAQITLWLCLDGQAFADSKQLHSQDAQSPRYDRGFYDGIFSEACVLIEGGQDVPKILSAWAQKIIDAWYQTS